MNQKDERIAKLWEKRGIRNFETICIKIGLPVNEENLERVKEGLKRKNLLV